jgi:hypothetical protein
MVWFWRRKSGIPQKVKEQGETHLYETPTRRRMDLSFLFGRSDGHAGRRPIYRRFYL